MNLVFTRAHKSITELPEIEIPNFTVITGVNGSGKTHLLEAIASNAISATDSPNNEGSILKFDWSTFTAQIADTSTPDQIHNQRQQAIEQSVKQLDQAKRNIENITKNVKGNPKLTDLNWMLNASVEEIENALNLCTQMGKPFTPGSAHSFAASFITQKERNTQQLLVNLKTFGDLPAIIQNLAFENSVPLLSLTAADITNKFPLVWNPNKTLQLDFANWFSAWHATYEYNKVNRYYHTQEGESERIYLGEEEFRELYGPEPWIITNEILRNAGFRHQFNFPDHKIGTLQKPFKLRLIDTEDGSEILTTELSSGEKIILAVALMLYQSSGPQQIAKLPKLLLLDEVDAPLHPSFTRSLLDTLSQKFVDELGVAVIMTTHSPSTVALAPEGSIYELRRKPRELKPCTSSTATQMLSSGYVSISRNDTIVITESSADPEYYTAVYSSLIRKGLLDSVPALSFIAASQKKNDGIGGGCPQVKNWAPKLHELGLERFRGLIDKDGDKDRINQTGSVVKVINRYSIENYLFDPFTLTAYLSLRGIQEPFNTHLPPIRDFLELDSTRINTLIMQLCSWIASKTDMHEIHESTVVDCDYLGNSGIKIPSWWITCNGHKLEKAIRVPLNSMRNVDALIKANDRADIINFQTNQYPELISKDFTTIFSSLITS